MNKSIKVVFIKQKPSDVNGYVFIRTIEGKTQKKKSLNINILKKDWEAYFNPNTQRFREDKRFPLSTEYNTRIEKTLKQLQEVKNDISLISDDKRSFLQYWEFCLSNTKNHGTIIKHKGIIAKLKKFLLTKRMSDLCFSEITPMFLKELKHYLETSKDPKSLSKNSVIHYLKVIKSIINKANKDDYYTYIKNPFNTITFKREKLFKGILKEDDLNILIKTKIEDEELNNTRDIFLFQLFSNGMRVSDVLLLKWKNIADHRINYTMFKTGTPLSISINLNQCFILSRVLGSYENYQKLFDSLTIPFTSSYQKPSPFGKNIVLGYTIKMFDDIIIRKVVKGDGITTKNSTTTSRRYDRNKLSGGVETTISSMDNNDRVIKYKGYKIWETDIEIKKIIDKREELVQNINMMFIHSTMGKINKLSKDEKNDFIFPILPKELFKNDFSKNRDLNLEQYKRLKHSTIVYNRKLKKVQQLCGIETNLTSHVSRHSFTNILLRMDVSPYHISQSLGHTNLKTTESYINGAFNFEKIDYVGKKISDQYSLNKYD
jgi:integrase